MKYTVQYLPLSKIKPALSMAMSERIRKLRRLVWDSVNLLAVRKNKEDGSYTLVGGLDRYEHMRNHTTKMYAPCIVEENRNAADMKVWFHRLLARHPVVAELPQTEPAGWSVIRSFLRREPRFSHLSRIQQMKVLIMGVRYKKTVVRAMKARVEEMMSKSK
ncbi:MAG: hypothetical protein K0R28_84 [Paenibacillus sp.]|jgi:hypothetical protein|nr:hypothetical protein [Paenibacillus sp.]